MSDVGDDVDRFIGNLSSDDEPPRGRRRKARDAVKAVAALPADVPEDDVREEEDEREQRPEADDDDGDASLLPRDLPRPSENHRSLGGMLGKYRIGEDPNFRIQLHRLLPKYLPGGIQAHGYLEEFVHPITEEYIA